LLQVPFATSDEILLQKGCYSIFRWHKWPCCTQRHPFKSTDTNIDSCYMWHRAM